MKRLPRITRTGDFSSAWNNQIAPLLDENFREARLQPGIGCRVSSSPGGQSIIVPSPAVAQPERHPWDIIRTTDDSGNPALRLWPGNVNGIMPENMFDTFTFDDTSLWYGKVKVTTDGNAVTSVELMVDTSVPKLQKAATDSQPTEFEIVVALYKTGLSYNLYKKCLSLTATQTFNQGYWSIG